MQISSSMPSEYYSDNEFFDRILPNRYQKLSSLHWTPIAVAKKAAAFLSPAPGTRILDIGSGVGKFCIAGAHHFPDSDFYGVEQRKDLVDCAVRIKEISKLSNVHFLHGNFTELNMEEYDSFYFFNSFYENLAVIAHIDDSIEFSVSLYIYYCNYLYQALERKPAGTRLVTFHGSEDEIPASYKMVEQHMDKMLKMWIKR